MDRKKEGITVYGTETCGDTVSCRAWLDGNGVAYRWVDVDRDREGYEFVVRVNNGRRTIPTVVFGDGSVLVEPTDEELAEKVDGRKAGG
jgi:glutaredoxin-like protein